MARYIHQNPVKVGLSIDNWTSYSDYINGDGITDVKAILEILNSDKEKAANEFVKFMNETNDDLCLDISARKRLTDEEAKKIIKETAGVSECRELQQMDKAKRNAVLKKLKTEDVSIRQISRVSGLNRGVILNA